MNTALSDMLVDVGIDVSAEQTEMLDRYRQQLWTWNERINLTRHTTLEKFVARDVFDSWQLCALLDRKERVLDVGTGGGVPGVVMAILRPDLRMSVSESVKKKSAVVEAIVAELELPVDVHACRAEEILEMNTFGAIVARAVAPLTKVLGWLQPHWDAFDELLLIKGRHWAEERSDARHRGMLKGLELRKAAQYVTPHTDAESVVLRIWEENRSI